MIAVFSLLVSTPAWEWVREGGYTGYIIPAIEPSEVLCRTTPFESIEPYTSGLKASSVILEDSNLKLGHALKIETYYIEEHLNASAGGGALYLQVT